MNSSIGRGDALNLPPRLPDFSSLDYDVQGHMKNMVDERMMETRDELLQRILKQQNTLITLQFFVSLQVP
jgi:hypothetical protein